VAREVRADRPPPTAGGDDVARAATSAAAFVFLALAAIAFGVRERLRRSD
jgi:hypothetical protein